MGVYIDMEMPKGGFVEILIRDDGTVQQTGQSYRIDGTDYYTPYVGEMPTIYKAVPVPPHGRLIDAGELRELYEEWENDKEAGIDIDKCHVPVPVIRQNIDDAPTIIPAEEGET